VIHRAEFVNNLDGDTSDHDVPKIGDRYEFTLDNQATVMRYCVKVLASSTYIVGQQDCTNRSGQFNYLAHRAWWGFEVYNFASAIGGRQSDLDTEISPMQYRTSGSWITVTGPNPIHWTSKYGNPRPDEYVGLSFGSSVAGIEAYTEVHTN